MGRLAFYQSSELGGTDMKNSVSREEIEKRLKEWILEVIDAHDAAARSAAAKRGWVTRRRNNSKRKS